MSDKPRAKAARKPRAKAAPYIPHVPFGRLEALIIKLQPEEPEAAMALRWLYMMELVEGERHGNRSEATATRAAALQIHWLREQKHARVKDAARAVLPEGSPYVDAACRMYRKMKAAHEFDAIMHKLDDPAYMEAIAAKLPKSPSGNK